MVEDMYWAWIAVQLGCKGKSHTATSLQVCGLLIGQRLNAAILETGVRLRRLSHSCPWTK